MNIFTLKESTDRCFASLIYLPMDISKRVTDPASILEIPGVKIVIYGQSAQTRVARRV